MTVELLKYEEEDDKTPGNTYTRCLRQRCKLDQWNSSNIVLIHEKGSKDNLKNNRPMSHRPIIHKLFTNTIKKRINILGSAQPRKESYFWIGFFTMEHIQLLKEVLSGTKE